MVRARQIIEAISKYGYDEDDEHDRVLAAGRIVRAVVSTLASKFYPGDQVRLRVNAEPFCPLIEIELDWDASRGQSMVTGGGYRAPISSKIKDFRRPPVVAFRLNSNPKVWGFNAWPDGYTKLSEPYISKLRDELNETAHHELTHAAQHIRKQLYAPRGMTYSTGSNLLKKAKSADTDKKKRLLLAKAEDLWSKYVTQPQEFNAWIVSVQRELAAQVDRQETSGELSLDTALSASRMWKSLTNGLKNRPDLMRDARARLSNWWERYNDPMRLPDPASIAEIPAKRPWRGESIRSLIM